MRPSETQTRVFDTRIDRRRAGLGLTPGEWAAAADMPRGQLLRYRSGQAEPRARALARLVRAARDVTGKPVRASDFYDLGEDEPLGQRTEGRVHRGRRQYQTRFGGTLDRYGFPLLLAARQARLSRRTITLFCAGKRDPRASTIATLVRAFRRMGADIAASDLFEL